jgi:tRNA dimethylallyltransferase
MTEPGAPSTPRQPLEVLAIMGPTASGKTQVGVALAKVLDGELVNADSRQAIAELAIGVCKPTLAELQGVACHGLSWRHLGHPFSVAEYRVLATAAVEEISGRDRVALVVGGTGLYIRALLGGFDFGGVAPDPGRTVALGVADQENAIADTAGRELRRLDPERAKTVDLRNPRRVVRAAELSQAGARAGRRPPAWAARKLGCRVSRNHLRARIEARSERLVGEPLAKEVEQLLSLGFSSELLARSAIGYSEVVDWVAGRCSRQDAVEQVVSRTWRYAKAQLTWLRTEPHLLWVDAEASPDDMVSQCMAVIQSGQPSRLE